MKTAVEYFMEEGEFYTDPTLLDPSSFSQGPPVQHRQQPKPQSQPKPRTKTQQQPQSQAQPRKKKQQKGKKQQQQQEPVEKFATKEEKEPKESKSDEDVITKYKEMINEFSKQADGPGALELPASLTSYIRMQIHEYASTIPGITHGSEGEGRGRHIVIRRTAKATAKKEAAKIDEKKGSETARAKEEKKETEKDEGETEGEIDEPAAAAAAAEEEEEEKEAVKEKKGKPQKKAQQKKKQQQGSKNKKKGKSQAKKPQNAVSTKGLDEIDAAVLELGIDTDTEHCAYRDPKTKKRCQQKVTLIYTTCKYCNKRFCFTHVQAEIHGCGAVARKQARAQVKEQYNELTKYKKMAEKKVIY